ncbi:MAG: nuclear transport factor 2 family protein [Cyanobacteria bacterium P01_F01_bin.86]
MHPKEIVKRWVEAFNEGNVDKIASFYSIDAVNHQVANEPIQGKEAIRQMFATEFAIAEMVCIVENLFMDGDWVILEWKDHLGLRGCGFFKIENNLITFQRGYWDKLSFLKAHDLPTSQ